MAINRDRSFRAIKLSFEGNRPLVRLRFSERERDARRHILCWPPNKRWHARGKTEHAVTIAKRRIDEFPALPDLGLDPEEAGWPHRSLFVRMPNIGGAENGACFPYPLDLTRFGGFGRGTCDSFKGVACCKPQPVPAPTSSLMLPIGVSGLAALSLIKNAS